MKIHLRTRLAGFATLAAAAALSTTVVMVGPTVADTPTATTPIAVGAPSDLTGAPALPFTGVTSAAFTIPTNYVNLTVTPSSSVAGKPLTISGQGLTPNTSLQLVWGTSTSQWKVGVDPTTVNYLGYQYTKVNINLATVTTDGSGAFTYSTIVPVDFGGPHDIYAVANGGAVAHGGFSESRSLTVTPTRGPVGTPITITYTGMGATAYSGGGILTWDNRFTGQMMANWTRGQAVVVIRATGGIGKHVITVRGGHENTYLNIQQSPQPYAVGFSAIFTTTKDKGRPATYVSFPNAVTPVISRTTTLATAGLDPNSTAVATTSPTSAVVNSQVKVHVTNLSATGPLNVVWSTVVGNRVNCTSTCWSFSQIPLTTATPVNGTLDVTVNVPDALGGWHAIQVLNGATIEAQVPFYVKESFVTFYDKNGKVLSQGITRPDNAATATAILNGGYHADNVGIPTYTFKAGQEFTINLRGVGWTQMDNTLAVDYDNAYVGYGCGFNSAGYVVIHLFASGAPGTHIIDLYPLLYTTSPSFTNTPTGMIPQLTYAHDFPGLALGYQVPSFHFAITIVK